MSTSPAPSPRSFVRTTLLVVLAIAAVLLMLSGATAVVRLLEVQATTAQAKETCGMDHEDFLKLPQATQDELRINCASMPGVFDK